MSLSRPFDATLERGDEPARRVPLDERAGQVTHDPTKLFRQLRHRRFIAVTFQKMRLRRRQRVEQPARTRRQPTRVPPVRRGIRR